MLAVIPDIDLFLIPFIEHRGPTHSIIIAFIIFTPIFTIYHKKAIPYFLALVQHSLIGDYISGGSIQLLWPVTKGYYGMEIGIKSQANLTMEWIVFLSSIIVMLKTRDNSTFFQQHNSNLVLFIPTFTVLMPTFLSFPLEVPIWLIPPHLFYMFLYSASIILTITKVLKSV